jgi:hypothetical protein
MEKPFLEHSSIPPSFPPSLPPLPPPRPGSPRPRPPLKTRRGTRSRTRCLCQSATTTKPSRGRNGTKPAGHVSPPLPPSLPPSLPPFFLPRLLSFFYPAIHIPTPISPSLLPPSLPHSLPPSLPTASSRRLRASAFGGPRSSLSSPLSFAQSPAREASGRSCLIWDWASEGKRMKIDHGGGAIDTHLRRPRLPYPVHT